MLNKAVTSCSRGESQRVAVADGKAQRDWEVVYTYRDNKEEETSEVVTSVNRQLVKEVSADVSVVLSAAYGHMHFVRDVLLRIQGSGLRLRQRRG